MPSLRDNIMARNKAARNAPAPAPRSRTALVSTARAPPVPAAPARHQVHKHTERKTIAGAVIFIGVLVIAGVVYSGMSTGPPEKPAKEYAPQVPAPARIARILIPGTGTQCREILFDNDTGYFSLEKSVSCDSAPPAQARSLGGSGGGGSFSSFKEAFGRKS